MTKPSVACLLLFALVAGGCDLINPPADMAGVQDLAGTDIIITPGPDFGGDPNSMSINWTMWDSMRSSHFMKCDDPMAGVTSITVTATDEATKMTAMTTIPCPAGMDRGEATIKLTNSTGFFDLAAVTAGGAIGYGNVMGARPTDSVNINIYLFGWDM